MEQKKSWIPTWLLVIGFLGSLYGLVHAVPDSSSSLGTRANSMMDNELDDETPMIMTAQMYVRRERHLPGLLNNAKISLQKRSTNPKKDEVKNALKKYLEDKKAKEKKAEDKKAEEKKKETSKQAEDWKKLQAKLNTPLDYSKKKKN